MLADLEPDGRRMRAAEGADEYRADPVGAYLALPFGMLFCARPELWGFALWGSPTPADVARILPLLLLQLAPSTPRHAALIDVRRLQDADPESVIVLARFLQEHADPIYERVTHAAVVRPGGYLGMLVAGFPQVVGVRTPVTMFQNFASAAAWAGGADVAPELQAAVQGARRGSTALVRLRQWLDHNIAGATLERAARAIGRAPRSLQRDLREASGSFQAELLAARLRRAKHLLAATEAPLTEIAYDVGCASPQHFSALFRKIIGMAPSAWRAHHRARTGAG
jgi:AraC-like DNA-binding protein